VSNSRCMKMSFETPEKRDSFVSKMVDLLSNLREQNHLERYFFNRYTNPKKNEYFILMGFFNFNDDAEEVIKKLLDTTTDAQIDPYDCETTDVDGVNIEELKCCSVEMYEATLRFFSGKPSLEQMRLILHFFMNQSSFGYEEESLTYLLSVQNIVTTLARK